MIPAYKPNHEVSCPDSYNADMRKTLGSKLFFLPHLPADVTQFVDFGCADGSLLKMLHKVYPRADTIGIDQDAAQLQRARINFPEATHYTPALWSVPKRGNSGSRVLIASSVLHELLSPPPGLDPKSPDYKPRAGFAWWWKRIEECGFDYVAIRDFAVPGWARTVAATPPDWGWRALCRDTVTAKQMADVAERYGSLRCLYNFMHFLLKRPYTDNWKRELAENYLALSAEELVEGCTKSGLYTVHHLRHTRTKHFVETTRRDLGFCPEITTHVEIVLRRNTEERSHTVSLRELNVDEPGAARQLAA